MKTVKIYRLEIWCAIDNRMKWSWISLSDFYTYSSPLVKMKEDFDSMYAKCKEQEDWDKIISDKTGEDVIDSRWNQVEIREYDLVC